MKNALVKTFQTFYRSIKFTYTKKITIIIANLSLLSQAQSLMNICMLNESLDGTF